MEWIQIYLFFVLQTHLPGYVDDFDKFKASNDSMNLFVFWSYNVFDYVQRCRAYVSQIKNYCTLYSLDLFSHWPRRALQLILEIGATYRVHCC